MFSGACGWFPAPSKPEAVGNQSNALEIKWIQHTRVVPEYRDKFYFTHLMMFNFAETFTVS